MTNFPERIIELKKTRSLLQKDIANAIGITVRNYQRYEKNEAQPTLPVLLKLADFFNVSLDYLVGRTNFPDIVMKDEAGNIVAINSVNGADNLEINKS